jgi:hypothetical protein
VEKFNFGLCSSPIAPSLRDTQFEICRILFTERFIIQKTCQKCNTDCSLTVRRLFGIFFHTFCILCSGRKIIRVSTYCNVSVVHHLCRSFKYIYIYKPVYICILCKLYIYICDFVHFCYSALNRLKCNGNCTYLLLRQ